MSTTPLVSFPRQLAFITGTRLIRWAQRPAVTASRAHAGGDRRRDRGLPERTQCLAEARDRDVLRWLGGVRQTS